MKNSSLLKLLNVISSLTLFLEIYQLDKEGVVIYIPIICNPLSYEYRPRDNRVLFTVTNPLVPYKLIRF